MIKEINYLKEHLYEIYKYKKSQKDLTYDMDLELLLRTCKALDFIQRENNQLQSNWNSLRECIIGVIEGAREELNTIIHTTDSFTYANQCSREFDVIRKNLEIVLDKMNELEGKDKQC